MNRDQLTEYIRQPGLMNEQSIPELKEVLDEYPFFQAARMLLLKNLHFLNHIRYNNELKLAAAHISDREKMFFLLNNYDIPSNIFTEKLEILEKDKITEAVDKPIKPVVTDYFDVNNSLILQSDFSKQQKENREIYEPEKQVQDNFILPSADLLDYERDNSAYYELTDIETDNNWDESRSFSSWLKLLRNNKIQLTGQEEEKNRPVRNEKMTLIDNFLQKGSRDHLKVTQTDIGENKDFSIKSLQESDDLMTETLADIFIKQKHFSKAINIFERLRLKYPEKNIYFALRIKELEEQINNL